MTRLEKAELTIIAIVTISTFLLAPAIRVELAVSRLVLYAAATLLLQGLVRDLWILARRVARPEAAKVEARCVCLESAVGLLGILLGLMMFALGLGGSVSLGSLAWCASIFSVLLLGFTIKDYVMEWHPWRIYQEKNHINVIVKWK